MNHYNLFHLGHQIQVEWIAMMEDLLKLVIRIHSILSIIVDKDLQNAFLPNVMDCRFGRSNHSNNQYHSNTSNHKGTIIEIG